MRRTGDRTSILQIIPPAPPAVETREGRRRAGEEPLGCRVREREITHTEVRRLHACKSVLGKFVFQQFLVLIGVHCVARLSKYRPSKPVTPLKHILLQDVFGRTFLLQKCFSQKHTVNRTRHLLLFLPRPESILAISSFFRALPKDS